jgi:hypothetical protein
MSKSIAAIIFSFLAVVVTSVGCGGGTSLTKAEFIKQADAICRKADAKKQAALEAYLLKVGTGPEKPMTLAQSEYQTKNVLLPPIRSAGRQIENLGAPDGEEDQVSAITKNLEQAIEKTEEEAEIRRKTGKAGQFNDAFLKTAKLAKEYGFKTCFLYY